ncbi:MAG: type II toxin-antitoxin system RelE/ParE family toxin [Phormidesmis sp.]
MKYTVIISKPAAKQIDKLPKTVKFRVATQIKSLATTPRPSGVVKMKSYVNQYRVRIGVYRVLYEIDDDQTAIKILQCRHRRDAYKDKG